ncbi:MAG TPA: capsule assembly Wzi family protein [Steroidobacteraceae bacterium]|nr:capsule assembly Wzi family protein [Steroidobacteraceae bacterium]
MASWIRVSGPRIAIAWALAACQPAVAGGVSGYLPLNLEPEMERQIERVLILADEPILKRPFAVALVEDALPQACRVDKPLCTKVKRYLQRYSRDYALTHASATGAVTHDPDAGVVPNAHGMPVKSHWEISAQGYVQPNDYVLLSGGGVSYQGRTVPTGSMLSLGFNWAQLDIGYRDHWFSPATDSSMLISTESPTMPSVTLSNYEPMTRLGFQYEFFATRLSRSDRILYQGKQSSGEPRLFGAQFSIEPFSGWSLGVNRLLEYGGGDGLPDGARVLLRNFFKPSGLAQNQGNQQASYISRFIFPGKTPIAVYFQYAGEDNSNGGSYLLGNAALTAGFDIPRIGRHFDLTYEYSEWQNIWYVHNIFLDGMSNDGLVLGNWGADQRNFGDGVGARSQMLRVGWEPPFGGYLEERIRILQNQSYYGGDLRVYSPAIGAFPYHRYYDVMVRYSRPWKGLTVGGQAFGGRDVDGKTFTRLSAFVRYGGDSRTRDDGELDEDSYAGAPAARGAERFVDLGLNLSQVRADIDPSIPSTSGKWAVNPHVALGARRAVTAHNDLGVRVELDEVDGHALVGVRALDYRYRFSDTIAAGLFMGAARYDLATPAYSVYYGVGAQWRNIVPKWDLGLELRHAQNLARDHMLASDPQGVRPESFYKIESALLFLSRRF